MTDKQEQLKEIIKKLHDGVPVDRLKKDFASLIKDTSPEEIADMENGLIAEGFPPAEIQRLCDVHAEVFQQSLRKAGQAGKVPGHPIYSFKEENKEAKRILKRVVLLSKKLKKAGPSEKDIVAFTESLDNLRRIELHYQRKENQLFPLLEAKHFTGPTQVMWGKHDEIRDLFREIKELLRKKRRRDVPKKVKDLAGKIKKLIFLEEKILYPTSDKKLIVRDWAEIKRGEAEIGYAWITPSDLWDSRLAESMHAKIETIREEPDMSKENVVDLSQGSLTAEQIDLLLKNLPVDLTYVDEHDTVRYYSDTNHRIFARSPAIIGRKVQNCHPPKSLDVVNRIVQSFKEKKKTVAEFWIQMDGKFIHIRYFPLYDEKGAYRGVIEVSQEVSGIKKLEGERRLLDWE